MPPPTGLAGGSAAAQRSAAARTAAASSSMPEPSGSRWEQADVTAAEIALGRRTAAQPPSPMPPPPMPGASGQESLLGDVQIGGRAKASKSREDLAAANAFVGLLVALVIFVSLLMCVRCVWRRHGSRLAIRAASEEAPGSQHAHKSSEGEQLQHARSVNGSASARRPQWEAESRRLERRTTL